MESKDSYSQMALKPSPECLYTTRFFLVENKDNFDKVMQTKLKLFEMASTAKLNLHKSMEL